MTEKIKVELGPVQKTLFMPLYARAAETGKEKPALVDRAAAEIMEAIDYDFSYLKKSVLGLNHAAMVMRALYIDRVVKEYLKNHPRATVVNIGCGMDTTFERVDNGTLTWFDLDLPDTMELRKKFLKESDRRRFITASFLEPAWLDMLKPHDGIFFISAGVFRYFTAPEVKGFIDTLSGRFPGGEILFDASSPQGLKAIQQGQLGREAMLMQWALEAGDAKEFLGRRVEILEMDAFTKNSGLKFNMLEKMMLAMSGAMMLHYMVHARFR